MTSTMSDRDAVERKEWRCFHCDELFSDERCARQHFGRDEGSTPACIIKGGEGGLLEALRRAEEAADDAIQLMQSESTDAAKAYHSQRCRHSQALIAAEQTGYDRGLADGRALRKSEGSDALVSADVVERVVHGSILRSFEHIETLPPAGKVGELMERVKTMIGPDTSDVELQVLHEVNTALAASEKQLEAMREALRFYGGNKAWFNTAWPGERPVMTAKRALLSDGGAKARAALSSGGQSND